MKKAAATIDGLYGHLELYLYGDSTAPWIIQDYEEWHQAHCPQLARIYANHGVRFEMAALGAKTTTELTCNLSDIMWIWDNRKTKAATEAKSIHELCMRCSQPLGDASAGK